MQAKTATAALEAAAGSKKMVCFQQDTLESKPILPIRRGPKVVSAHSEKGSPIGC